MTCQTVDAILRQYFAERPERVCLYLLEGKEADRAVTYGELEAFSVGYAQAYAEAGIQAGDVVILILQHGLDLIAAFWGAVLHGAVPAIMPFLTEKLQPDCYRRDLGALFEVTRPAALVTYPEFAGEAGLTLQTLRAEQSARGAEASLRAVLLRGQVRPAAQPASSLPWPAHGPGDIVFLQHSSGTTGLKKGVAITHVALLNQLASYRQAIRLVARDVVVSWLPLYHDMGLVAGFLLPFIEGNPLVLMSPFDWVKAPYRLMQAVTRYNGTLSWLPNFAFNFCAQKIRDAQLTGVDLSSWRAVINCSEPVYWSSMRLFYERFKPYGLREEALAVSYAMAENVFGVTQAGIEAPLRVERVDRIRLQMEGVAQPVEGGSDVGVDMVSCGHPISGSQVQAFNSQGRALPERQVGELAVNSNCMLAGYYHRPDVTERAFVHGWYLTGDYGYLADGEVFVTGRKKDLIIVGGRNVFPQDIEAAANDVPGIHPGRAVAFGVFNPALCTEDVGLVAEADLDEAQMNDVALLQELEDRLRLKVNQATAISLRYVRLVGPHWLIKTSSGKIARTANRDKFLAEQEAEHSTAVAVGG